MVTTEISKPEFVRPAHHRRPSTGVSFASRQVVLQHSNGKTAHDDQQIKMPATASRKLRCAVHRAKSVFLFTFKRRRWLRFRRSGQHSSRVHRHLFARHGVRRKAGRNPQYARRLGNHDEVDHHQNRKHNQTDSKLLPIKKVPLITAPAAPGRCGLRAKLTGRSHVQRQAHQRGQQQHRREGGKVQRLEHISRHHHHHQSDGDIEKNTSSSQVGMGSTISAKIATTNSGADIPWAAAAFLPAQPGRVHSVVHGCKPWVCGSGGQAQVPVGQVARRAYVLAHKSAAVHISQKNFGPRRYTARFRNGRSRVQRGHTAPGQHGATPTPARRAAGLLHEFSWRSAGALRITCGAFIEFSSKRSATA